jgi:hypothetical protein
MKAERENGMELSFWMPRAARLIGAFVDVLEDAVGGEDEGVVDELLEPAVNRGASFCRFAPPSGAKCISISVRWRLAVFVATASGAAFSFLPLTWTSSR